MKRDLLLALTDWRHKSRRKPLLLRGARQVGKSWLIREFGKQFEYFFELNFETKSQYKAIFADDASAKTVIERLNSSN